MLTNPLRDRFGIVARLEFYTPRNWQNIVSRSAGTAELRDRRRRGHLGSPAARAARRVSPTGCCAGCATMPVKAEGMVTTRSRRRGVAPCSTSITINRRSHRRARDTIGDDARALPHSARVFATHTARRIVAAIWRHFGLAQPNGPELPFDGLFYILDQR